MKIQMWYRWENINYYSQKFSGRFLASEIGFKNWKCQIFNNSSCLVRYQKILCWSPSDILFSIFLKYRQNVNHNIDGTMEPLSRQQGILWAEKAVLNHPGGIVFRLGGLYTLTRGALNNWLSRKTSESNSSPNGLINLIHYDDAAEAIVTALKVILIRLVKMWHIQTLAISKKSTIFVPSSWQLMKMINFHQISWGFEKNCWCFTHSQFWVCLYFFY